MPSAHDSEGFDIAVQSNELAHMARRLVLLTPADYENSCATGTSPSAVYPISPSIESLGQTAERILEHLSCDTVGIRLVDENGNATDRAGAGIPGQFCKRDDCRASRGLDCICPCVLHGNGGRSLPLYTARGTFVIGDTADRNQAKRFYQRPAPELLGAAGDYQSLALAGIRAAGCDLGLIHCAAAPPHWFTAERISWLETTASEIGEILFYDSLWRPAQRAHRNERKDAAARCPICGRRRDETGSWVTDERGPSRMSWAVVQFPRVVCPHCLRFCNSE